MKTTVTADHAPILSDRTTKRQRSPIKELSMVAISVTFYKLVWKPLWAKYRIANPDSNFAKRLYVLLAFCNLQSACTLHLRGILSYYHIYAYVRVYIRMFICDINMSVLGNAETAVIWAIEINNYSAQDEAFHLESRKESRIFLKCSKIWKHSLCSASAICIDREKLREEVAERFARYALLRIAYLINRFHESSIKKIRCAEYCIRFSKRNSPN